jgi:hypothetical protein
LELLDERGGWVSSTLACILESLWLKHQRGKISFFLGLDIELWICKVINFFWALINICYMVCSWLSYMLYVKDKQCWALLRKVMFLRFQNKLLQPKDWVKVHATKSYHRLL